MQWECLFKDGTKESGEGILSKNAWDNSPSIILFKVGNYTVDLNVGTFNFHGVNIYSPFGKQDYRLIYYRKVQATVGTDLQCNVDSMTYFFGWQVTVDGKNYKRVFQIVEDGLVEVE